MKKTMKKGFILPLGLLLMAVSCQEKSKPQAEPEPEIETKETVKPPSDIISLQESKSLYDNYTRNRVAPIQAFELETNQDESFKAARFVDFDYDTIKNYIAYVEQEAKKANVDVSTFRFYFANYPNTEKFPDGKKVVHPRQNSIFLLPTLNQDGQNFGFYIGADGKAKLIKNAVNANGEGYGNVMDKKTEKAQASMMPAIFSPSPLQGDQSLILNHGGSGPPPETDY